MRSEARVVVIGGGVVGCSVLYHLARAGWRDLVLVERDELTSGSTWHAAGGMHTLNGDPNVAKLQQYTIALYREIEERSGQSCGVHLTGGVMLADTPERLQWLKMAHARGRYLGMETELISMAEAKALFPLMDERHFVGALYDPIEGHVDPAGVTHAYAKAARLLGAEIVRRTRVTGLAGRPDGWDVETTAGTIRAEHVVNAGGLWAREVGRMVGLELPVLAMEHMYLITEDMPEVAEINRATGKEVLHCIDFGGEIYMRQERGGMLMGTYERAGVPWSPKVTPWEFGHELLAPDLDRIAPSLEVGFAHFPPFEKAGIKRIVNGPFTFSPDGNPLVGPVRGLPGFWVACGVMAGFSQGGGVGLALANWMTEGDPGFDVWAMDVARFGAWATPAYTKAKVRENYSRRFRITFPNEELPAGRPLRTTPLYDRLKALNAVMGSSWGVEHALWFQEAGEPPVEAVTFERSNAHPVVGRECAAVRGGVGLLEISNFAKYQVTGAGAEAWLSRLLANRVPRPGRMTLTPMLDPGGKLIGDFTLACESEERFWIFGSGMAQSYHMRWFEAQLPADGRVRVRPSGLDVVGLAIAGPRSRALLAQVTDEDVSAEAFRFLDFRRLELGMVPALVGRISYTGDLGYEIWVRPEYLLALFELLTTAGAAFALRPFGARALNSLRLEKSFGSWAREYRPIYGPAAAGLDRFVAPGKGAFIGRDAALREREAGPERKLVTLVVDAADADVIGDEPIWHAGRVVGWVTSGGWAHHVRRSVALGYLPAALAAAADEGFEVEILGERRRATLQPVPLFDPAGERMRG
ncbi:MAG TPA: FAD-dependent oxidoreductase [Geminicoccaceae bacterium]|nr:FAD-dependent oxidoreductase [Geminicoccaceae bacterium]